MGLNTVAYIATLPVTLDECSIHGEMSQNNSQQNSLQYNIHHIKSFCWKTEKIKFQSQTR